MSLQGKSHLSLKGLGEWGRFLRTGGKQISLLSSRRTRGRFKKLQAVRHHLGHREGAGANNPRNFSNT